MGRKTGGKERGSGVDGQLLLALVEVVGCFRQCTAKREIERGGRRWEAGQGVSGGRAEGKEKNGMVMNIKFLFFFF